MKEQYIRRVKRALNGSRRVKKEVIRDLNEIFASAAAHGEAEEQVIERLGAPEEFAGSAAESLGLDVAARRNRRGLISCVVSAVVAALALAAYAGIRLNSVPDGAIGQADAMTGIQIEGALRFDASQIMAVLGGIALALAIFQMIRALRGDRRKL